MWRQSNKDILVWIHRISTKQIHATGRPPFLTLHPLPTLEDFTRPTKNYSSSKNCTQFDFLPSEILHNISTWYAGIVRNNKLKSFLAQLTQFNSVLHAYTSYKLKYAPFNYYMHYDVIQYAWTYIRPGPHKSNRDCKWEKRKIIKYETVYFHMTI